MFDQNQPNTNSFGTTPLQPQPPQVSDAVTSNQQPQSNSVAPDSVAPPQLPVDDIFSGVSDVPAPTQPYGQYQPAPNQYSQVPGAVSYSDLMGGKRFDFAKVFAIGVIIFVLVVAIVAGIWIYLYLQNQTDVVMENGNTEGNAIVTGVDILAPVTNDDSNNTIEAISTTTTITLNPTTEKDSDGDGLTDAEELVLGTDPNNADSDFDGLTDWAEVKIYKTDPLNPDTDGDGYKDGEEVIAGYDPNKGGGAKLFEVPQSQ